MTDITPTPGKRRKTEQFIQEEDSRLSDLIHAVKREHVIKSLSPRDLISFAQTSKKHAGETKQRLADLEQLQLECREKLTNVTLDLVDTDESIDQFIRKVYEIKCPLEFNRAEFIQNQLDFTFGEDHDYFLAKEPAFSKLADFSDWDYTFENYLSGTTFAHMIESALPKADKVALLKMHLDKFAHELVLGASFTPQVALLNLAQPYLQELSIQEQKQLVANVANFASNVLQSDMFDEDARNALATVRLSAQTGFQKIISFNNSATQIT